ncbi:MAG: hypothetical protein R3A80_05525 [Bdellovibrionota bacterium]
MKINLGLTLFILSTSLVSAQISYDRVQDLLALSGKINHKGPNCVASVFYASNLIDDYSFVATASMASVFDSTYCAEVSPEERAKGDLVVVYGEAYRYEQYIPHVALLTDKDTAFSKMGFETTDAAKVIQDVDLKLNPGGHIPVECLSTLSSSTDQQRCIGDEAAARYFRCDFENLRKELNESGTFREIQNLRNTVLGATQDSLVELKNKSAELSVKLIDKQNRLFPENPISSTADTKKLEPFLSGFRIESYLFESMENLPKDFKLMLFEAALLNSLDTQISFLSEEAP